MTIYICIILVPAAIVNCCIPQQLGALVGLSFVTVERHIAGCQRLEWRVVVDFYGICDVEIPFFS